MNIVFSLMMRKKLIKYNKTICLNNFNQKWQQYMIHILILLEWKIKMIYKQK